MMTLVVVSLVIAMVHSALQGLPMASLDHLMTHLQEEVAGYETSTEKENMQSNMCK